MEHMPGSRTQRPITADTVPKPATGHDPKPILTPILTAYFTTIHLYAIFSSSTA